MEREIREKERARIEKERINLREKMVIREDEGNGKIGETSREAETRLCNYLRIHDYNYEMPIMVAQFSAPPGELQKSSSGRRVSSSTSSSKRSSGSGVSTGIIQRRGAIKQFKVAEEIKGHKFVAKFFRHPSFCSICQGFLW